MGEDIKEAKVIELGYYGKDESSDDLISIMLEKPSGERFIVCPGRRANLMVFKAEDYYLEGPPVVT